jgi:hypothetical protein
MKSVRSSPAAFRFDPDVKKALVVVAAREGRSMANMLERLIKQHCEREALGWPVSAQGALDVVPDGAAENSATNTKPKKF